MANNNIFLSAETEKMISKKTHIVEPENGRAIIAPIREVGWTLFDYRMCHVTVKFDVMQEPNLVSVICKQTNEDLLPRMDSTSKQKTLHNLFNNAKGNIRATSN